MLTEVRFIGIDNFVDSKDLKALSTEFPFIKYGVLASNERTGNDMRYLELDRYQYLTDLNLALHICGIAAKNIMKYNDWEDINKYLSLADFNEIQINIGSLSKECQNINFPKNYHIILQMSQKNREMISLLKHKYQVDALHDNSGGRGVEEKFWPPYSNFERIGYAGGITPDNVDTILNNISAIRQNDFWIDMESGIRTDNKFDVNKCYKVASIASQYIKKGR